MVDLNLDFNKNRNNRKPTHSWKQNNSLLNGLWGKIVVVDRWRKRTRVEGEWVAEWGIQDQMEGRISEMAWWP